ncbi:MAG: hypothetical protein ABT19_14075 [Rhodanobacter sp. SCN 68-63]|nr:MAG: hypothetical protein ABT19_14075 [Rhodanobacter sp. SCN 68-63]
MLAACLLLAMGPVSAQLAPRLTAQLALDELATAQADLAKSQPSAGSPLAALGPQLAGMADALRQSAGGNASQPVELVGDALRARIVRAHAAAARVQAYLAVSGGCGASDTAAMQVALSAGVERLAAATAADKQVPVIDSVQNMANVPLFAMHPVALPAGKPLAFALVGSDLADAQCADPRVSATDAAGKPLASQPVLTGASPARLELRWPEAAVLPTGPVVLHVATQRKVFLLGCSALPEADAVVQVAPPVRFDVDYVLEAVCPAQGGTVPLGHGRLPTLNGYGATVSQAVNTSACAEPDAYRLSATVTQADGSSQAAGPFTQSAQATITAGLPGGLSMSWSPTAQALFVRSGAATCKGAP